MTVLDLETWDLFEMVRLPTRIEQTSIDEETGCTSRSYQLEVLICPITLSLSLKTVRA